MQQSRCQPRQPQSREQVERFFLEGFADGGHLSSVNSTLAAFAVCIVSFLLRNAHSMEPIQIAKKRSARATTAPQ
jgi:hypothetical protein